MGEIMRQYGFDQLPVVDEREGVLGVVTLGQLTSKILSKQITADTPVKSLVFSQCRQVPVNTRLSDLFRIFEKDAFCLVVTSQRSFEAAGRSTEKKIVVAVCSRIDLVNFVLRSETAVMKSARHEQNKLDSRSNGQPSKSAAPPASDAAAHRSPDIPCSSLAWSFMAKKSPLSPEASPQINPTEGLAMKSPKEPYTDVCGKMEAMQLPGAFLKEQVE